MAPEDPPPAPTGNRPKSLGYWLKRLHSLWHGDHKPTRFDNRLERLSRHREEGRAGLEARMLKTTSTARWWRRFR